MIDFHTVFARAVPAAVSVRRNSACHLAIALLLGSASLAGSLPAMATTTLTATKFTSLAASADTKAKTGVQAWKIREDPNGDFIVEGYAANNLRIVYAQLKNAPEPVGEAEAEAYLITSLLPGSVGQVIAQSSTIAQAIDSDVYWPMVEKFMEQDTSLENNLADLTALNQSIDLTTVSTQAETSGATLTAAQRKSRIDFLFCMNQFANQAYWKPADLVKNHQTCGLEYDQLDSNAEVKIWTPSAAKLTKATHIPIIISFRGTSNLKDWGANLKNMVSITSPKNPLDATVKPVLSGVGKGWDDRWRSNAGSIKDVLMDYAKHTDKSLRVFVVGHSLGSVTATVAGFDIENWLEEAMIKGTVKNPRAKVSVFGFNQPKAGKSATRSIYQDEMYLKRSCKTTSVKRVCLQYHRFYRGNDFVNVLPPGYSNIWYNTKNDGVDIPADGGTHNAQHLGYCPMVWAKAAAAVWNITGNHSLAKWRDNFKEINSAHLKCMLPDGDFYSLF